MNQESKKVKEVKEEKINRGHHAYRQYLEEAYGILKTNKIVDKNGRRKLLTI